MTKAKIIFYLAPEHTPGGQEEYAMELDVIPQKGTSIDFLYRQRPPGWFQDSISQYRVKEVIYTYTSEGSLDHAFVVLEDGS